MNAKEVIEALRLRHANPRPHRAAEWAFFTELRAGTGYKSRGKKYDPQKRFDAWAINLYPSKGHLTIAYEVKVSRSDFLHEIKNPDKRKMAMSCSNEYYFVTPVGLVKPEEIPEGLGLIEVKEDLTSKVKIKASYRDIATPSWNFLASIARRISKYET